MEIKNIKKSYNTAVKSILQEQLKKYTEPCLR